MRLRTTAIAGLVCAAGAATWILAADGDKADKESIDKPAVQSDPAPSRKLVDKQAVAVAEVARSMFPETYAGTSIDNPPGLVTRVSFTGDAASSLRAVVAELEGADPRAGVLLPREVRYSMKELEAVRARIEADIDSGYADLAQIAGVGTLVEADRIEIGFPRPSPPLERRLEARYGMDLILVRAKGPSMPF